VLGVAAALAGILLLSINLITIVDYPESSWDIRVVLLPIIEKWWDGTGTLYPTEVEDQRVPGVAGYRYPPVWAVAMLPLVLPFEIQTAVNIWRVLSLVVFFGGLAFLMRELQGRWLSPAAGFLLLLIGLLSPFYETFFVGPTKELFMVGLMAATFALVERKRPLLAGLTFAVAILHKIYPVLFVVYFVVRRDLRMLAYTAGWGIVLNVLPLPFTGVRDTFDFYFKILPFAGGSFSHPENAGFEVLLMARGWIDWFHHGVEALQPEQFSRPLALAWRLLVLTTFVALALVLERRRRLDSSLGRFLLFGSWIAGTLAIIPVAWANYQVWLAFPLAGMLLLVLSRPLNPTGGAALVASAVTFIALSMPLNVVLMRGYAKADLNDATTVGRSVGEYLLQPYGKRRGYRLGQLEALRDLGPLSKGSAAKTHEHLVSLGVHHAGSRGPELEVTLERYENLRRMLPESPDATQRGLLARTRQELRLAKLTTGTLIRLMVYRSAVGMLAFLAACLACASLLAGRGED
jgi:hypothetical protein